MPPDDDDPSHTTLVTRTTSTHNTICITCTAHALTRALTVSVRDANRRFSGVIRITDADAPYDHYLDIAACALTDPRQQRVRETFTFTLDDVDGDDDAKELVWSFREEDYNVKFRGEAVEDEIPSTPTEDGIDAFERTRVGVLTLRASDNDEDDMIAIARGYERAREMVMTLEEDGARLVEASEAATRRASEATEAKASAQEECARRFVALLNTKKSEIRGARDKLEAADVELETLRSRLERGGGREALETTSAAALDGDDDDGDDDDDDGEQYATDDENVPTQRGERISMRKKFARATQPQSQAPSQAARRKRGGVDAAAEPSQQQQHTQSQSTKTAKAKKQKNKSFLADALLDCLDTA